ncbi:MAG: rod shape-determining protein MreC [Rikenellaceae bacterium]
MLKLLLFLKKLHLLLLFIIIEAVALYSFFHSTPYTRATAQVASSVVTGYFHNQFSSMADYLDLREQNELLLSENAQLRLMMSSIATADSLNQQTLDSVPHCDALIAHNIEDIKVVRVIRNSLAKSDNYITLNKGLSDGVEPDMALFTTDGIVGYILESSSHYSIAISMLNVHNFRVGGKLKGSNFTGLISWSGDDYRHLDFDEMPKYADLKVGDTIVTSYSNIFPDDLPIGVVEEFSLAQDIFFSGRIRPFVDMSNLGYLYAVKLKNQQERDELESLVD